jgi:hypothetical protein
VFREGLRPPNPFRDRDPMETAHTQDDMTLKTLSELAPTLVVCLPELGGNWCRRMLQDLAAQRAEIEKSGTRLVLVHMAGDADAALRPHDLGYVARIADPDRDLYRRFGLEERPRLLRTPEQLPGVFLLENSEVRGKLEAERQPDYRSLLPGPG